MKSKWIKFDQTLDNQRSPSKLRVQHLAHEISSRSRVIGCLENRGLDRSRLMGFLTKEENLKARLLVMEDLEAKSLDSEDKSKDS